MIYIKMYSILLLIVMCTFSTQQSVDIISARVESCRGCSLNRLPEVKQFIYNDLPKYEGVEWRPIQGAPPELILVGPEGTEERLPLSGLSRAQCNELLRSKGFKAREDL